MNLQHKLDHDLNLHLLDSQIFERAADQKMLTKGRDVLDSATTGVLTGGYSARFAALPTLLVKLDALNFRREFMRLAHQGPRIQDDPIVLG